MIYRKRPDKLADPGPLLAVMRTCRDAMIEASSRVKPMGTTYQGLGMVVAAIDALAVLLTGRDGYFWGTGHGATDAAIAREKTDRAAEGRAEREPKGPS